MEKSLSRIVLPEEAVITAMPKAIHYPGRNEDESPWTGAKSTVRYASPRWIGEIEIGLEDEARREVVDKLDRFLALIADGTTVFILPAENPKYDPGARITVRQTGSTEDESWALDSDSYILPSVPAATPRRTNPSPATNTGWRLRSAGFRANAPREHGDLLQTREATGNYSRIPLEAHAVAAGDGATAASLQAGHTAIPKDQFISAGGRLYMVVRDDVDAVCVQPSIGAVMDAYIDRRPVLQCKTQVDAELIAERRGFFWGPWTIPWVEAPEAK